MTYVKFDVFCQAFCNASVNFKTWLWNKDSSRKCNDIICEETPLRLGLYQKIVRNRHQIVAEPIYFVILDQTDFDVLGYRTSSDGAVHDSDGNRLKQQVALAKTKMYRKNYL